MTTTRTVQQQLPDSHFTNLHHGAGGGAPSVAAGCSAVLSVWKLAPGQEPTTSKPSPRASRTTTSAARRPAAGSPAATHDRPRRHRRTRRTCDHVLAGHDPSTGTRLGQPHKVPGYDLTFRAPKSVSVLFGLGDPDTARAVRDRPRPSRSSRRSTSPNDTPSGHAEGDAGVNADPVRWIDRGGVPTPHESQRRPASPHPRARAEHGARRGRQVGDDRRPLALHDRQDDRLPVRSAAPPQPHRRARRRVGRGAERDRRHRSHPRERAEGVLDPTRRDRGADGDPRPALAEGGDDRRARHPPEEGSTTSTRSTSARRGAATAAEHRLRPGAALEGARSGRRRHRSTTRSKREPSRITCSAPPG